MGLSRNKVAVSEGAAGSPPFYGERVIRKTAVLRRVLKIVKNKLKMTEILREILFVVQFSEIKFFEK